MFTDRNLLLLTLAYFALNYFQYIFFYWIYYYFSQVRQMGYGESARYTTIVFATMAVMMPLGGWISDRLTRSHGASVGRRVIPMVGLSLGALLLLCRHDRAGESVHRFVAVAGHRVRILVRSYVSRNMISHYKIEANVRFCGKDVAEWLRRRAA